MIICMLRYLKSILNIFTHKFIRMRQLTKAYDLDDVGKTIPIKVEVEHYANIVGLGVQSYI